MTSIANLTELTDVDETADFVAIVDTSTNTTKKAKPKNLVNGYGVTKGNMLAADGTNYATLTVGSNNQVLTADSAQTYGVKWATPATGGQSGDMIYPLNVTIGDYASPAAATSSSDGTGSATIVWSSGGGFHSLGGDTKTRYGQEISTGNSLIGKEVTSITFGLRKSAGGVAGTFDVKVRNSADTVLYTLQTAYDISTLTTSFQTIQFTLPSAWTVANGDKLTIEENTNITGGTLDIQADDSGGHAANAVGYHYTPSSWTAFGGGDDFDITWTYNEAATAARVYDGSTTTYWISTSEANPAIYVDLSSARDIASIALNINKTVTTETQIKIRCSTDTSFSAGETVRTINISDFTDDTWRFIPINRLAADCRYVQIYGSSGSTVTLSINEIKVYYAPTTTDWNRKHFHKYLDPTSTSDNTLDSN